MTSLEAFEAETLPDRRTGMSVIHRASIEGDSEKVREVFSVSPGLMDTTIALRSAVETPNSPYHGKTASEIAKMFDSQEHCRIVELLKEYGNGTESRSLIHMAARIGTLNHLKRLFKRDTDVNEVSHNREDDCSTLLNLAAKNNTREVIQWLVSHGADPHTKDLRGFNPVHSAAISGREEIVGYFLDLDESLLFTRSEGGLTILHLAAWSGHKRLVEFLLSRGLDVNCASNHEGGLDDSDVESADTETFELGQETREFAHWVNEGTTPVMMAASSGHLDIVKLLVSKAADLLARDNENRSCLFFAVRGGQDSVVKYLIEAGLDIQTRDVEGRCLLHIVSTRSTALLLIEHGIQPGARDETEKTALHHVAIRGDVEVAQLLIELGEDINARDMEGLTPLDCAINNDACFSSCFERLPFLAQKGNFLENTKTLINSRRQKIAQLLINSGCEIEVAVDNQTSSLHHAVKFDMETVKLLVKSGASVNVSDEDGRSPLHEAASVGKTETIHYLLMQGANINAADKEGMTPLLEAADAPSDDAFKTLLENGASINVANRAGDTALHLAARGESLHNVELLLSYASRQSSDDVQSSSVPSLLNKTNKKGKTALFEAAKNGDRKTLTVLLERGSALNIRDAKKRTILHAAASARNSDALKFLMRQRNLNVNQVDVNGETALHVAVQKSLCDNVLILLHQTQRDDTEHRDDTPDALKCDVNAKNKKHRTPLHLAARDNYSPEILQLLIKCGGNVAAVDKSFNIPLHYAAGNRLEIVKALLQEVDGHAERDVIIRCANAKNSKGRTPLHEGARRNEKGIVAFLLDVGSHVNAVDQFRRTSLHYAATHHSSDTVKVLVRRGADMNAVDQDGNTPLHAAAAEYSQGPSVRFLRQQGSNMEALNKDGLSPDSILRNKAVRRSSLVSCSESESSSESEESDSD